MKRRITVEQLNKLTDEQRKKLREWWKPSKGDCIISNQDDRLRIIGEPQENGFTTQFFPHTDFLYAVNLIKLEVCFPILDIGQMIELLHSLDSNIDFGYAFDLCRYTKSDEICDRLWNALKEML